MSKEVEVEVPYDVWLRLNQAFQRYKEIAEAALTAQNIAPKKGTPILFITRSRVTA